MKKFNVSFNDFDKKGLRKNGETLPMKGGVCLSKKGIDKQPTLYVVEPESGGRINGVALIFENVKERTEYLKKMEK